MSETGGARPDVSKLVWATGPGANPITEPAGGQKQAGYDPGPPGEIPTAENWNWLLQHPFDVARWMDAAHIREFADISEAIAATSAAQVFRVGMPTAGNRFLGQAVFSAIPATFTAITGACSDGERAYYLDTSTAIYAANSDTGAQVFAVAPVNITNGAIAADGQRVYVAGDGTFPGLVYIDRDTGAILGRAGTPTSAGSIASNGAYAVIGVAGGGLNNIYYYDVTTTPNPTETGNTAHGNPVGAVAVDAGNVYWGGVRGGGIDLRANFLSTRGANWTSVFPTTGSTIIADIVTDGQLVFCGGTRAALTAGGNANLFIVDAATGGNVAEIDVQDAGTDNITDLALDQDILYCTLDGGTNRVLGIKFTPGPHIVYRSATGTTGWDADGAGIITDDGAAAAERYFSMIQPRTFERVLGTDVNRQPWHKLAIPSR